MPLLEYACQEPDCGIKFEALILSDHVRTLVDCPRCHSKKIEWVPSACVFKFRENPLGSYRGACANAFENLTLHHVRGDDGQPITVHSLKELREMEKKYGFVHAVASDDHIEKPPQHEVWAGDIRHDYQWKWTPPEDRDDMTGVSVGPTTKDKLLVETGA